MVKTAVAVLDTELGAIDAVVPSGAASKVKTTVSSVSYTHLTLPTMVQV